jgi:hypothetical protein
MAYGACASRKDTYAKRYTYVISPEGKIEMAIDTKDPGQQAGEILARC